MSPGDVSPSLSLSSPDGLRFPVIAHTAADTLVASTSQIAHCHARYGENEVLIEIETWRVLRGVLPRRDLAMVEEWCELLRPELRAAWDSLHRCTSPDKTAPLE